MRHLSTHLTLSLLLAACQERAYFGTVTPRHPPTELWVNNGGEPEWIDPGKCADAVGGELVYNLFAGLTQPHPKSLRPMPELAERWQVSDDGRRYTFYLRETTWSDGTPFGAEDFVWSWRRVLDPSTASKYASLLYVLSGGAAFNQRAVWVRRLPAAATDEALLALLPNRSAVARIERRPEHRDAFVFVAGDGPAQAAARARILGALDGAALDGSVLSARLADGSAVGVRAPDAYTLEVELAQPVPYFLELTHMYTLMPVPRHVIERLEREGKNPDLWTRPEHIVTNGPYTIRAWRFRQYILLEKNPRYWDAANVRLERVRVFEVESSNTTLNLYRTGELDWIGSNTSLPAEFIDHLRRYRDFRHTPYLTLYWYWLNSKRPPLDDVRVRRALSLAIDREAITTYVKRGGELPTGGVVPDGLAGYHAPEVSLFDPEAARRLLAEAGYVGGRGMRELVLIYNTSEGHKQIAEAIQQMWKTHLGVRVRLENQEWKVFLKNVDLGNFDIARLGWTADYADPYTFLEVFVAASGNNHSGWSSAAYDALLARANATHDRRARLALLREAEELLIAAQPVLPIYVYTRSHLVKPYVMGLWDNFFDRHPFKWMWIDARWYEGTPAVPLADAPPPEPQE